MSLRLGYPPVTPPGKESRAAPSAPGTVTLAVPALTVVFLQAEPSPTTGITHPIPLFQNMQASKLIGGDSAERKTWRAPSSLGPDKVCSHLLKHFFHRISNPPSPLHPTSVLPFLLLFPTSVFRALR